MCRSVNICKTMHMCKTMYIQVGYKTFSHLYNTVPFYLRPCTYMGIDISDIGKEVMIHWNGPPLDKADNLVKSFMDNHFGTGRWNFITLANDVDSSETKRMKGDKSSLHF